MTTVSARLRVALLSGRRKPVVRGGGAAAVRQADGYEFVELRSYVVGDDPRRIDWAATARVGDLQTRVVMEERALSLVVALDGSGSMRVGKARSAYASAREVAALWYEIATDDDRCARVLADRVIAAPQLRGRHAAQLCSEIEDRVDTSFEASLRTALAAVPRGAHILLVSDFFELTAWENVLRACGLRFDCTALVVRDPWQEYFPLGGFVRLRDAETGQLVRMYIGQRERERYAQAVAEREMRLTATLESFGIRTALMDTNAPQQAVLTAFGLHL